MCTELIMDAVSSDSIITRHFYCCGKLLNTRFFIYMIILHNNLFLVQTLVKKALNFSYFLHGLFLLHFYLLQFPSDPFYFQVILVPNLELNFQFTMLNSLFDTLKIKKIKRLKSLKPSMRFPAFYQVVAASQVFQAIFRCLLYLLHIFVSPSFCSLKTIFQLIFI